MLENIGRNALICAAILSTAGPAWAQQTIQTPSGQALRVQQVPAKGVPQRGGGGVFDPRTGGITVVGQSVVTADAQRAQVTLNIGTRNNQPLLDAATLQPVAEALIAAHADPKSVILPIYLVGPGKTNFASVSASVSHPTAAMLIEGMQTLSKAFEAIPNLVVQQASVYVLIDNCVTIKSQARRAALEQAKAQALDIASQSGVHVGKILAVQSFGDGGGNGPGGLYNPNSCGSWYQIGYGNYPQFTSMADYLKVRLNSSVTVTYAIK